MRLYTFYCLSCGKLKQGDSKRVELNICEDCDVNVKDSEEDPI
jgi:NMD protein affecting ribosome stability and mRNA decay